jgi:hypothetical protein
MLPSKCPGCQQLFEDPRGFANHKWQCRQVKVTTVRRLKEFQARKDKGNRSLTQVRQAGDDSSHVEEGQGGPATIAVDGMPLVHLGLQLTLVQSDLSVIIRMRSPASQPQNCVPLANRIERFDFPSTMRMRFHHILLLCPTRDITYFLANLVRRKMSSLENPNAFLHPCLPPQSRRHTAPAQIHMGYIAYIQIGK